MAAEARAGLKRQGSQPSVRASAGTIAQHRWQSGPGLAKDKNGDMHSELDPRPRRQCLPSTLIYSIFHNYQHSIGQARSHPPGKSDKHFVAEECYLDCKYAPLPLFNYSKLGLTSGIWRKTFAKLKVQHIEQQWDMTDTNEIQKIPCGTCCIQNVKTNY